MASKSTRQRSRFACLDCKVDTGKIGEFYYLTLALWLAIVGSIHGMLCIGCAETRLGRKLTRADFTDATVNQLRYGAKSARLIDRLTH